MNILSNNIDPEHRPVFEETSFPTPTSWQALWLYVRLGHSLVDGKVQLVSLGRNPSGKYESQLGWQIIPDMWENKLHVPVSTNQIKELPATSHCTAMLCGLHGKGCCWKSAAYYTECRRTLSHPSRRSIPGHQNSMSSVRPEKQLGHSKGWSIQFIAQSNSEMYHKQPQTIDS